MIWWIISTFSYQSPFPFQTNQSNSNSFHNGPSSLAETRSATPATPANTDDKPKAETAAGVGVKEGKKEGDEEKEGEGEENKKEKKDEKEEAKKEEITLEWAEKLLKDYTPGLLSNSSKFTVGRIVEPVTPPS